MNTILPLPENNKECKKFSFSLLFLYIVCLTLFWINPDVFEARMFAKEINDEYSLNNIYSDMLVYSSIFASLLVAYLLNNNLKVCIFIIAVVTNMHAAIFYFPTKVTIHEGKGELVGLDTTKNGYSIIKGKIDDLDVIDIPNAVEIKEKRELNITENQTYHYYWREHDGVILPVELRSTPYFAELNLHK